MATLRLEIVTPESRVFSADVENVTLPGVDGELGIYPLHVPLMTQINCGELVIRHNGTNRHLAVGEGFVEITGDRVAVLTDMAVDADHIDEAKAEKARKEAATKLEQQLSDEEIAVTEASLAHATTQLEVKRRRQVS